MIAGRTKWSESSKRNHFAAGILLGGLVALLLEASLAYAGDGWVSAPGWEPAARVGVAFQSRFQPTKETLRGLETAIGLYGKPECYWIAAARAGQASELESAWAKSFALQAALIERDVAPTRVVAWTRVTQGHPPAAEIRIYCSPPPSLSLTFENASAALNEEIRTSLDILNASVPRRDKALVIRGFAAPDELADPLKLAIDRAFVLRQILIESNYPGQLIQVEADTRARDGDGPPVNAEILLP